MSVKKRTYASGFVLLSTLLLIPIIAVSIQLCAKISSLVLYQRKLREECFTKAITELKKPIGESESPAKEPRKLVFEVHENFKQFQINFTCGAEGIWKDSVWQYETILDKF